MHILPLLVITGALVYLYRYYHYANHPNPLLHKFHKRVRVCLGFAVVCTLLVVAYRLPDACAGFLERVQANQVQLAQNRQEARQASEIAHLRQMIDALGGPDNYLALQRTRQSR